MHVPLTTLIFGMKQSFAQRDAQPKIEAQIDFFFKQANDNRDKNVSTNQAGQSDRHPVHRISLAIADLQSQSFPHSHDYDLHMPTSLIETMFTAVHNQPNCSMH